MIYKDRNKDRSSYLSRPYLSSKVLCVHFSAKIINSPSTQFSFNCSWFPSLQLWFSQPSASTISVPFAHLKAPPLPEAPSPPLPVAQGLPSDPPRRRRPPRWGPGPSRPVPVRRHWPQPAVAVTTGAPAAPPCPLPPRPGARLRGARGRLERRAGRRRGRRRVRAEGRSEGPLGCRVTAAMEAVSSRGGGRGGRGRGRLGGRGDRRERESGAGGGAGRKARRGEARRPPPPFCVSDRGGGGAPARVPLLAVKAGAGRADKMAVPEGGGAGGAGPRRVSPPVLRLRR